MEAFGSIFRHHTQISKKDTALSVHRAGIGFNHYGVPFLEGVALYGMG